MTIVSQGDDSRSEVYSLFRESSYSLLMLGGSKVIMFAAGVILARILGTSDLGVFTILITIASLASSFSSFGIPAATTQMLASDPSQTRVALISGAIVLGLSITCSLTLALAGSWIAGSIYAAPTLTAFIPIVATFVLLNNANLFLLAILQGLHSIRLYNLLVFASSALYLVFITVGAATFGLVGAVWANSAYLVLALVLAVVSVLRRGNWRGRDMPLPTWEKLRGILRYAAYLTAGGALAYAAQWYGPTVLVQSHAFEALGLFRVANTLTANLMIIPMAIAVPLFPSLARQYSTDSARFLDTATKSFRIVVMTTLPLSLLMCLFPEEILMLLFGRAYGAAGDVLFIMSAAGFLMAINNNAGTLYYGTGEMRTSMLMNGIWGIVFCGLAFFLIPSLSAIGMGLTYLGSYGFLTVIQLRLQRAKWGIRFSRLSVIVGAIAASYGASYYIKSNTQGGVHYLLAGVLLLSVVFIELVMLRPDERQSIRVMAGFGRARR